MLYDLLYALLLIACGCACGAGVTHWRQPKHPPVHLPMPTMPTVLMRVNNAQEYDGTAYPCEDSQEVVDLNENHLLFVRYLIETGRMTEY